MATTVATPIGRAPLVPVALLGIGGYLAWYAVHYWGSTSKWPSDPVKAVLQGKPLPAPTGQQSAAAIAANVEAHAQTADTQTGVGASSAATGNSGSGVQYTHATLMTLWTSNGGSAGTANVAAAVAMAESAGQPGATSSNPDGGTNVGLWQLDTKGVGTGYTIAQLQNATTNVRVTIMGSANGTNWSPWATFGSGAYRQFLT